MVAATVLAVGWLVMLSVEAPGPGTPVCDPGWTPPARHNTAKARADGRILYINFEGGEMQWCGTGVDDPADNCSTVFQGLVAPYRGDFNDRLSIIQSVRADLDPYDISVTDERPESGDYDMEMVGDWLPVVGGGFAGIAPKIDCLDGDGGDVSFTLDFSGFPQDTAKVILQEVAHTWGLEHVNTPGDLLYPITGGSPDPSFTDACHPITYEGVRCPEQHAMFCPAGSQNAHAELLEIFGPSTPDDSPPSLEIVSPPAGALIPDSVTLVLEIDDDVAPQAFETTIELVGITSVDNTFAGPDVIPVLLQALPPGDLTIRVTTQDESGNSAEAEVQVTVRGEVPPDAGSDTGDTDTDSGTSGTGSQADDGGCRVTGTLPTTAWPAWLVGMLAIRRRRRAQG